MTGIEDDNCMVVLLRLVSASPLKRTELAGWVPTASPLPRRTLWRVQSAVGSEVGRAALGGS